MVDDKRLAVAMTFADEAVSTVPELSTSSTNRSGKRIKLDFEDGLFSVPGSYFSFLDGGIAAFFAPFQDADFAISIEHLFETRQHTPDDIFRLMAVAAAVRDDGFLRAGDTTAPLHRDDIPPAAKEGVFAFNPVFDRDVYFGRFDEIKRRLAARAFHGWEGGWAGFGRIDPVTLEALKRLGHEPDRETALAIEDAARSIFRLTSVHERVRGKTGKEAPGIFWRELPIDVAAAIETGDFLACPSDFHEKIHSHIDDLYLKV